MPRYASNHLTQLWGHVSPGCKGGRANVSAGGTKYFSKYIFYNPLTLFDCRAIINTSKGLRQWQE